MNLPWISPGSSEEEILIPITIEIAPGHTGTLLGEFVGQERLPGKIVKRLLPVDRGGKVIRPLKQDRKSGMSRGIRLPDRLGNQVVMIGLEIREKLTRPSGPENLDPVNGPRRSQPEAGGGITGREPAPRGGYEAGLLTHRGCHRNSSSQPVPVACPAHQFDHHTMSVGNPVAIERDRFPRIADGQIRISITIKIGTGSTETHAKMFQPPLRTG